MKDYVLQLASSQTTSQAKLNIMREYLQASILRILHEKGFFRTTAFLGGTALRFLYNLPRFSEDLDFSSTGEKGVPFLDTMRNVKGELHLAGYDISISCKDSKAVQYAFIKFNGLLHEAGLTPHPKQLLSIKIEVDTHPPAGALTQSLVMNKYFPLALLAYDVPSLFSGKLHALLMRRYTKGRDFFDLGWYLSKWKDLSPNMRFLQNALRQTNWKGDLPQDETWREVIVAHVEKTLWKTVQRDVMNFLERPADMAIFTKESVMSLLKGT